MLVFLFIYFFVFLRLAAAPLARGRRKGRRARDYLARVGVQIRDCVCVRVYFVRRPSVFAPAERGDGTRPCQEVFIVRSKG